MSNIAKQEKVETEKNGDGDGDSISLISTKPQLLCCTICSKHLKPPIYQCKKGHLACSCCYKEKSGCGIHCGLPMSNDYPAIDLIYETIGTLCPNKQHGCTEIIKFGEEYEHEIVCPFTLCPFEGCKNVSSPNDLYGNHFLGHEAVFLKRDGFNSLKLERKDMLFLPLVYPPSSVFLLCNRFTEVGNVVSVCIHGEQMLTYSYEIKIQNGSSSLSCCFSVKNHKSISEMVKFPTEEYMLIPSHLFGSNDRLHLDLIVWRLP